MTRVVAIHQPNFFPALSYFKKMADSDIFVFLDDVQFSKQSFTQRNRIRNIDYPDTPLWLTVPVKNKSHKQNIDKVLISRTGLWKRKHLSLIHHNYREAPHYMTIYELLRGIYVIGNTDHLAVLNNNIIHTIMASLGITTCTTSSSSKALHNPDLNGSDRILDICKRLGADVYLSGKGGREYLNISDFSKAGIRIEWQEYFGENQLSIIDTLMMEGIEGTKRLLTPQGR